MTPPTDDDDSRRVVERILDSIVSDPALNEFKHTQVPF